MKTEEKRTLKSMKMLVMKPRFCYNRVKRMSDKKVSVYYLGSMEERVCLIKSVLRDL